MDWAKTQSNLGSTHLDSRRTTSPEPGASKRPSPPTRCALKECTRDRVPLDWAMTQNNLGIVLRTLGGRESDTARLNEAVAAFRNAR